MRVIQTILLSVVPVLLICSAPESAVPEPMEKIEGIIIKADSRGGKGERVLTAFAEAYPEKVERVEFRENDWAVMIRGEWFFWAEGRLLPEEQRDDTEKYVPYPWYEYPNDIPPIRELTPEEKTALEERLAREKETPIYRHPGIYNALWQAYDRESSWRKVKTTYFLGLKTEIHRELLEDLAAVEEEIQNLVDRDDELRQFVRSIADLEGYNWRKIAGTEALSFHSYGIAIDILPDSYKGKQSYWRWALPFFPDWHLIPYEQRFMPPLSFIRAFENHGFIWGGKWFFFDTIHFEYRPEILILNGFR